MAITEEARHHLYQRLEQVLGSEEAATMMEHLPPVGWADVATRRDLDQLELRIDARFEKVDARFDRVDDRFEKVHDRFDQLDLVLTARLATLESRLLREFGAYRDQIHAEHRTTQRHIVVALVVALLGVVVAALGLG